MTELNIFYRYFVFAYFLPCLFSRFLGLNVTIAMKHFSSGGGLHAANSSQPTYQSSQQTTGRVTRSIKKCNVAFPPPPLDADVAAYTQPGDNEDNAIPKTDGADGSPPYPAGSSSYAKLQYICTCQLISPLLHLRTTRAWCSHRQPASTATGP